MNREINDELWVSTKNIAVHLGVTVDTVRKWNELDKGPCHRVGKLWKFQVSEVDFCNKMDTRKTKLHNWRKYGI